MNKLDMGSKDIVNENIEKISELFPGVIVESENGKSIDFDLLKQELSKEIIEGNKEKYQLTWPGKKEAILNANTPCNKTLRPIKEKSIDFDNTENIYIEGDNLDGLKILQESYLNKINCIYIDPPYNTGNDFIYNDNFNREKQDELMESGQIDEMGNYLISNNMTNGRYHSNWLSMMYSRLKLSRNLLSNDGLIFISIDDYEYDNLKKICDEIFGENNYINTFIWKRNSSGKTEKDKFTVNTEYIVLYSKSQNYMLNEAFKPLSEGTKAMYSKNDNDGRGYYRLYPLQKPGNPGPETTYDYIYNNGKVWPCPEKGWRIKQSKLKALENDGRLYFEGKSLSEKAYWDERPSEGKRIDTLWDDLPENSSASKEIENLFGKSLFSNPKPTKLIKRCLEIASKSGIVLDFFSGSATTAHSLMQLNAEDGGKRKFILMQLPEFCDENSEAYKKGYKNICDIGEARIRYASEKIKAEINPKFDCGFRVYKIDSSNMKDVYYTPNKIKQSQLEIFESNIKEDRTSEDLLTQVILDLGLTLDLKIAEKNILKNKVYFVDENSLIACFDNEININVVDEICKYNPLKVVFKDESFKTDNDKINLQERFKKLSPNTEISIL